MSNGKFDGSTDLWILITTMVIWFTLVVTRSVLSVFHQGDAAASLDGPILVLTGFFVGHKVSDKVDRNVHVDVGKVISPHITDEADG